MVTKMDPREKKKEEVEEEDWLDEKWDEYEDEEDWYDAYQEEDFEV
jgi:hypothetical protein